MVHIITQFYVITVEHCMSVISAVANAYVCSSERPLSKSYATQQFAHIFEFTEYAPWKAMLMQVNIFFFLSLQLFHGRARHEI